MTIRPPNRIVAKALFGLTTRIIKLRVKFFNITRKRLTPLSSIKLSVFNKAGIFILLSLVVLPSKTYAEKINSEKFFNSKIGREVEVVEGEIIVRFKPRLEASVIRKMNEAFGNNIREEIRNLNIHRIKLAKGKKIENMLEMYRKDPNVLFAEPNYIARALAITPNDPSFSQQWGLSKIYAPEAWDIEKGNSNVIIAIVDTGIDLDHPDLDEKIFLGYDFVNEDSGPMDDNGHGTHCAGIAAAESNNGQGITGVAWGSKLMPVKVLDSDGTGTYSDVAEGIIYAADKGARVINLSLGAYSYSQTLQDAVDYAYQKGCVIVAAAGNDNTNEPLYPAAYGNVIGVAATDQNDERWTSSNYGDYIDVSAPGVNIYSTFFDNAYMSASGTSASAPFVSGLVALLLSQDSTLANYEAENKIRESADDLGTAGHDEYYGYGRTNSYNALVNKPTAVHDVAIIGLDVSPTQVESRKPVTVTVKVQNQGDYIESNLEVKLFLDDRQIGVTKNVSLNVGESKNISFSWTPKPSRYFQRLESTISTLVKEKDKNDNSKTREYLVAIDEAGQVRIMHAKKVHQYVCVEAQKIVEEQRIFRTDEIKPGVFLYKGDDPYDDREDDGTICGGAYAEDGSWEPDKKDHVYHLPWPSNTFTHFWSADDGDDSAGLLGQDNAWQKAGYLLLGWYNILEGKQYAGLVDLYKDGYEAEAYDYLGHVAHLLVDMSVPAHAHNEGHAPRDAAYENWMGKDNNHKNWKVSGYKIIRSTWGGAEFDAPMIDIKEIQVPDGISEQIFPLYYLMYTTNQRADYFASDAGYNGTNGDKEDRRGWMERYPEWSESNPDGWPNHPIETWHLTTANPVPYADPPYPEESEGGTGKNEDNDAGDTDKDKDLTLIGDKTFVYAIRAVATLYKFFWDSVHPNFSVTDINVSENNPVPGDSVTVSATVTHHGYGYQSNVPVKFYVDTSLEGTKKIGLDTLSSTRVSFNWTATSGNHNLKIAVDLDVDLDSSDDYDVKPIYVGTPGDLLVNGSPSPSTLELSATAGTVLEPLISLTNSGDTSLSLTASKSGQISGWTTLPSVGPFTILGKSNQDFVPTISVPYGTSVGTYSGSITFTYNSGANSVSLPIKINVNEYSPGHNVQTLESSSVLIDGDSDGITHYRLYDMTVRLNDYDKRYWSDTIGLSQAEADKLITMNWDPYFEKINAPDTSYLGFKVNSSIKARIRAGSFPSGAAYHFTNGLNLLEDARPGSNTIRIYLDNFVHDKGIEFWDINHVDGRDTWWTYECCKNAWAKDMYINTSDLQKWRDGWVTCYISAKVDNVYSGGKVYLFNNMRKVYSRTIDSAHIGRTETWRIDSSQLFEGGNRFNFRGDDSDNTRITLSNITFHIEYYGGDPSLIVTKSLSSYTTLLNQPVTVTLTFENIGSNIASEIYYDDSPLPAEIQLHSGSLNGYVANLEPGRNTSTSYQIKTASPGIYTLPPRAVTYQSLGGDAFETSSNAITLTVNGGTLQPDVSFSSTAMNPRDSVTIYVTVKDSISGASVTDALVKCKVTSPQGYVQDFFLPYDVGEGKYLGVFSRTDEIGDYTVHITAERDFYTTGETDPDPTFKVLAPPKFDASPTTDKYVYMNGGKIEVTSDLDGTYILKVDFSSIDSTYSTGDESTFEIDTINHVFKSGYTIRNANTRPDGIYVITVTAINEAGAETAEHTNEVYLNNNPPKIVSVDSEDKDTPTDNDEKYHSGQIIRILALAKDNETGLTGKITISSLTLGTLVDNESLLDKGDGKYVYYWHTFAVGEANDIKITVTLTDIGQLFVTDESLIVTIDNTPPTKPEISSSHPENYPFSDINPSFDWTASTDTLSGMAGYSYKLNQLETYDLDVTVETTGTSASFTKQDGTWWFHLRGVDKAGNGSEIDRYKFIIDTTSPTFTASSSKDPAKEGDVTITVQASEELKEPPTVNVKQKGQVSVTKVEVSSKDNITWTGTYPVVLEYDGAAIINVSGVDLADNIGTGSGSFEVDTIEPTGSISVSPTPLLKTGEFQIELTITDASIIPQKPSLGYTPLGGSLISVPLAGSDKSWSGTSYIESTTPDGTAKFSFSAIDAAGNVGTTIISGEMFEIDTTIEVAEGGTSSNNDGTKVEVPKNAVSEKINIRITVPDPNLSIIREADNNLVDDKGINPIKTTNLYRSIIAIGESGGDIKRFDKPIAISIPYPDGDQNGIVDKTNIREASLRMFYLDENQEKWLLVPDSQVDPNGNNVTARVSHFSIYTIMQLSPASSLSEVFGYPNPCYVKRDGYVRISNIPLDAKQVKIYIYNVAGELVRTLEEGDGIEELAGSKIGKWDGRNENDETVASGIYVYLIKSRGTKKTEKIAIFW